MTQASSVKENDKSLQAVADGYLQKDLNSSVEFLVQSWSAKSMWMARIRNT